MEIRDLWDAHWSCIYKVRSHFWGESTMLYKPYMKSFIPIHGFCKMDVTWKAPWMLMRDVLYSCGDKMWVPFLGILGPTNYASLLVLRHHGFYQFILETQGFSQFKFACGDLKFVKKMMEITNAWKETRRVSLARFTDDVALGYLEWKAKWGGNITLPPRDESIKPINPQPKKTLSEAEILR